MKGKGHKGHHHRKHHRAEGGRTHMVVSGNPDVLREAEEETSGSEKKHGGKVHKKHVGHAEGKMAKHRRDRAHGGKVHHGKHHRAKGGRVGSDKSPLSSAHHSGPAADRAHGQPD